MPRLVLRGLHAVGRRLALRPGLQHGVDGHRDALAVRPGEGTSAHVRSPRLSVSDFHRSAPSASSSAAGLNQLASNIGQTGGLATGLHGSTMNRQQPASPRTTFALRPARRRDGPVPAADRSGRGPDEAARRATRRCGSQPSAGIAFMLAGVSIAVGAIHGVSETGELPKDTGWWMRLFYYAIGLVIAAALAMHRLVGRVRSGPARLQRHRHVPAVAGSKRDGRADRIRIRRGADLARHDHARRQRRAQAVFRQIDLIRRRASVPTVRNLDLRQLCCGRLRRNTKSPWPMPRGSGT